MLPTTHPVSSTRTAAGYAPSHVFYQMRRHVALALALTLTLALALALALALTLALTLTLTLILTLTRCAGTWHSHS